MQTEIKTWLYDILNTIVETKNFIGETGYDLEAYSSDAKTGKAVERNLEIIGEAINRILSVDKSIAITKARKIVDTRNRISHGYDKVSHEIIWDIVQNSLPLLQTEVEYLLKQEQ
jgi:uncharacterized protein with HEPN domain